MNMSVPSEWQVLVSLCTDKTVRLLSHVVNITVYSGGMFWCKLWQHFGWQLLYWTVCHMLMYAIYPFQKYKFTHYCMWDIDWKRLDRIPSYTFTSGLTKKKKKKKYLKNLYPLQCHCDIDEEKEIWAQRWK